MLEVRERDLALKTALRMFSLAIEDPEFLSF